MSKKYKIVRMNINTYNNFNSKKLRLEETAQRIYGKRRRVPFIRVLDIASKQSLWLDDNEVKSISNRRRRL